MKILLFCPTYNISKAKTAMRGRTQESINDLITPEGVEMDVVISADNPNPITGDRKADHENTLYQYRKARRVTLDGDYDALLTIEHDMIVPADALEKMLDTDADVVYGLYRFRQKQPILNCCRAVSSRWADMSITYFPELIDKGKRQGWLECSGDGLGCTLIHRRVLEKIDFRRAQSGHPSPDLPFASDCQSNNFKQICRFDVPCGHIKPDGEVLWPFDKDGETMSKVKIYVMRSFNATINGRSQHFEEGTEAEMSRDHANDYVRAGFISLVGERPAVKVVQKPGRKRKKAVK
jgi:hypothetical protein